MQYTYASLEHLYAYTPKLMSVVGALISGNMRTGLSPSNHRDYYDDSTYYQLRPARLTASELTDAIDNMDRTRITQDHHLYVSRHELAVAFHKVKDFRNERQRAVEELLKTGSKLDIHNQVTFITMATYVLVAPIYAVRLFMKIYNLSGTPQQFMTLLKLEGGAAKQNQTVFRDDLAAVFELQVLRNRVFDTVDWAKEIEHRVKPETAPFSRKVVFERAQRIFAVARAEGRRARNMKWKDYWSNRVSAMPNGSIVSQYGDDHSIKKQLPFDGRVKSAWFAANQNASHDYWVKREPEIYASTSTKYEWGKVRALYGCDVTSFIHADYSMKMVENTLPSYFPVGDRANDKYVKKVLDRMNYGVPFCYDYDDFNSQHSISSMQAVIDAWASVYGRDLTREQLHSLAWTKASIARQTVFFSDIRQTHRVHGTLLSGWRLTSFINTVLNRVYLEEAGLLDHVEYAVHNGDDMYASCNTIQDAMEIVRRGKRLGIRAQVSKTNIGTIGEFLRVDARARNPTGAQYLARAVSTAVHGRIEIGKANDARNALQAVAVRAQAMIQRGANRATVSIIKAEQDKFLKRHFRLSDEVADAFDTHHPLQGGWNKTADIYNTRVVATETTESENHIKKLRQQYNTTRPGVRDYVKHLCKTFSWHFSEDLVEDALVKYADSLIRWITSYEIVIDDDAAYTSNLRGLIGAHVDDPAIIDIAKARQIGMGALPAIANKVTPLTIAVAKALKPYKYLAAVTSSDL